MTTTIADTKSKQLRRQAMEMNVELFMKGFVATLITSGLGSIQPHSNRDRTGFQKVIEFLNGEIEEIKARDETGTPWYRQLVRVRNRLLPSNSGAFDSFEKELSDLQLSFTGVPNAFYEDIEFKVSRPFASSFLEDDLNQPMRLLVEKAADEFINARSHVS
ncbi:MAG: hypothetical protein ACREA4_10760 [Nitrososphaera sp.]